MYKLRQANFDDLPVVMQMAKEFITEYLDNDYSQWDEATVIHRMVNLMKDGYFSILEKDGVVVGTLGAVISTNMWNMNIDQLEETFWWVIPEYRKSRAGYLLIKSFLAFAKQNGYKPVLHTLSHSPVSIRAMEKLGLKLKEHTFYLE